MSDIEYIIETALNHQRAGRLAEAADIYRKVLAIEPGQADAVHLLGMVSFAEQDYSEAISLIGKAIALNPTIADYHINIASAYLAIGDTAHAKSHATIAIQLNPNSGKAHYNLGNAWFAEGEADQAGAAFRQALDLDPKNQTIWANYLFALNFSSTARPREIFDANRKWGALLEDQVAAEFNISPDKVPEFSNDLNSDRRVRLAYFLPELDLHVTTRFLSPILAAHDKTKFEIIGYGYRTDGGGPPERIKDAVDRWVEVGDQTPAEIAAVMRHDQIDILLHPCSFKSRYRDVLAHRAAPVQIACTNLVSTTGLQATDYLVTDGFISPPHSDEGIYTEKLIRLSSFNTYQQPKGVGRMAPLPVLKNGYVTFGSCNNVAKLSPEVLLTWSEILTAVTPSKLLLKHRAFENAAQRALILGAFAAAGIAEDRIIFEGFTADPVDYIRVYNKIDIALDPFPFGGGTVSYEALWMGVPVLTLAGEVFMGRLTGSMMHRLELSDWVVHSPAEYIAAAIQLAGDTTVLADLRKGLRARAKRTLFDAKGHVGEFEAALIDIWQQYRSEALRG